MQVMHEVASSNPVSRGLFRAAFNSKRAAIDRGDGSGGAFAPLWNTLVFSKVKAKLGGRVRLLTTGASPISPEVMAFLRVCFPGATVLEGYGVCRALPRSAALGARSPWCRQVTVVGCCVHTGASSMICALPCCAVRRFAPDDSANQCWFVHPRRTCMQLVSF